MSMKNSDNNNNETDRFSKSEKPVFLYTVIGVLTVAVIALAAAESTDTFQHRTGYLN